MATVLDAFVVTLGLDASQYQKQQKEATAAWGKTKDEVAKSGKAIEDQSKKVSTAFRAVAIEALGMFAVFAGSSSLKNFVTDLIAANTQLGYFGARIGVKPGELKAWENAAASVGGTADATAASFQKIATSLFDLKNNGQNLPTAFYQLEAWSKTNIDTTKGPVAFMEGLATAAGKMAASGDGARAAMLLQNIGLDPGTINLMIKGGPALKAYIDAFKQFSPTAEQIKASQDISTAWSTLNTAAGSLGNSVLPELNRVLTPALTGMTEWVRQNKGMVDSKVDEVMKAFSGAMNSVDWGEDAKGAGDFASNMDSLAAALRAVGSALKTIDRYGKMAAHFQASLSGNTADNSTPHLGGLVTIRKGSFAERIMSYLSGGSWVDSGDGLDANGVRNVPGSIGPDSHHAGGGAIGGGRTSVVGEHGPELFTPGQGGTITPAGAFGKGDLQVDGRTVNRTNPVPVTLAGVVGGAGGENWLQTLGKGVASFFGGGGDSGGGSGSGGGASGGANVRAVGPSAGVRGWWTAERQKFAYDYLRKNAELSDAGAKGLISRWVNVESRGGPSSANNIGGGHFGLAQWSRSRGKSIWGNSDFTSQLALVAKELKSNEKAAGSRLRNAKTDTEGAIGASSFERAEGYNPSTGVDNWTGKTLAGMRGLDSVLAKGSAASFTGGSRFAAAYHNTGSSSSSNAVHINGPIVIHTQATDAKGISRDIGAHLSKMTLAAAANTGLK